MISTNKPPATAVTTRTEDGNVITGPVVFGVNQTVSIWCIAENTAAASSRNLQGHFWRSPNGTRLPAVNIGEQSDHDIYVERLTGNRSVYSTPWIRVAHFQGIQASSGGIYTCFANYNKIYLNQSVEVQVSSE